MTKRRHRTKVYAPCIFPSGNGKTLFWPPPDDVQQSQPENVFESETVISYWNSLVRSEFISTSLPYYTQINNYGTKLEFREAAEQLREAQNHGASAHLAILISFVIQKTGLKLSCLGNPDIIWTTGCVAKSSDIISPSVKASQMNAKLESFIEETSKLKCRSVFLASAVDRNSLEVTTAGKLQHYTFSVDKRIDLTNGPTIIWIANITDFLKKVSYSDHIFKDNRGALYSHRPRIILALAAFIFTILFLIWLPYSHDTVCANVFANNSFDSIISCYFRGYPKFSKEEYGVLVPGKAEDTTSDFEAFSEEIERSITNSMNGIKAEQSYVLGTSKDFRNDPASFEVFKIKFLRKLRITGIHINNSGEKPQELLQKTGALLFINGRFAKDKMNNLQWVVHSDVYFNLDELRNLVTKQQITLPFLTSPYQPYFWTFIAPGMRYFLLRPIHDGLSRASYILELDKFLKDSQPFNRKLLHYVQVTVNVDGYYTYSPSSSDVLSSLDQADFLSLLPLQYCPEKYEMHHFDLGGQTLSCDDIATLFRAMLLIKAHLSTPGLQLSYKDLFSQTLSDDNMTKFADVINILEILNLEDNLSETYSKLNTSDHQPTYLLIGRSIFYNHIWENYYDTYVNNVSPATKGDIKMKLVIPNVKNSKDKLLLESEANEIVTKGKVYLGQNLSIEDQLFLRDVILSLPKGLSPEKLGEKLDHINDKRLSRIIENWKETYYNKVVRGIFKDYYDFLDKQSVKDKDKEQYAVLTLLSQAYYMSGLRSQYLEVGNTIYSLMEKDPSIQNWEKMLYLRNMAHALATIAPHDEYFVRARLKAMQKMYEESKNNPGMEEIKKLLYFDLLFEDPQIIVTLGIGTDEVNIYIYNKAPLNNVVRFKHAEYLLGKGRCQEASDIISQLSAEATGGGIPYGAKISEHDFYNISVPSYIIKNYVSALSSGKGKSLLIYPSFYWNPDYIQKEVDCGSP